MQSPFDVTVSSLPGDQGEVSEPLRWGRALVLALIFTAAAGSAALLIEDERPLVYGVR